jgi:hypothetical protein
MSVGSAVHSSHCMRTLLSIALCLSSHRGATVVARGGRSRPCQDIHAAADEPENQAVGSCIGQTPYCWLFAFWVRPGCRLLIRLWAFRILVEPSCWLYLLGGKAVGSNVSFIPGSIWPTNYSFLDMLKCSRLRVVSQPQSATDPTSSVQKLHRAWVRLRKSRSLLRKIVKLANTRCRVDGLVPTTIV